MARVRDSELTTHIRDFRGTAKRGTDNRGLIPPPSEIEPGSQEGIAPAVQQPAGWFDDFAREYNGEAISEDDWATAAKDLSCEIPAIKAVAAVESGALGAFWRPGWPIILYERHLFSAQTAKKFDKEHPNISSKTGYRFPTKEERKKGQLTDELYAWNQDANYSRLEEAYSLDKSAALKSASWGKFQILGKNHKAAGSLSAEDYVRSACTSEREQFRAFTNFLKDDLKLLEALQAKDWDGFAKIYNGKDYKKFNYDTRMKTAYDKEKRSEMSGP